MSVAGSREQPTATRRQLTHAVAVSGLVLLTWLAFGSTYRELGHRGDSWVYMSYLEHLGPGAILVGQPGRLALPWAWALGFAIAGAEAWTYHLFAFGFMAVAAVCVYSLVDLLLRRQSAIAFAVAALSVVWPSDPTRYDIATLGNRQALAFTALGALLYVVAYTRRRPLTRMVTLTLAHASLIVALLTYEAQLALLALLPVLLLIVQPRITRQWVLFTGSLAIPAGAWVAINAITTVLSPGGVTYQTRQPTNFTPQHILTQLVGGTQQLFVDAWRQPIELLQQNAVPSLTVPIIGTLLVVTCLLAMGGLQGGAPGWRTFRPPLLLVGVGLLACALGALVFAVLTIPLRFPDRTHTFTMVGAAVVAVGLLCGAIAWLPLQGAVARWLRSSVFTAGCATLVFLCLSMAAVYHRNYRDLWREQRAILTDILRQTGDIQTGALVIVDGLPTTRIVLPAGYDCEFALTYLFGDNPPPPGTRIHAETGRDLTSQQVNCGLLFNGPAGLDPYTKLEFLPDGVHMRFLRLEDQFPYDQLIVFHYDGQAHTCLWTQLPPRLRASGADATAYAPEKLYRVTEIRPAARRVLDLSDEEARAAVPASAASHCQTPP